MKNFSKSDKSAAADFNDAGKALKIQIGNYISFYKKSKKQISMQDDNGGVENVDTSLPTSSSIIKKDDTFRSSLVICMMKGYVAKCEGSSNHPYGAKVLNFMLSLAASGNQKGFEYVSANLGSVSLQHIKRLTRERRPAPFIGIDGSEIVNRLRMHFAQVQEKRKKLVLPFNVSLSLQGLMELCS
jgi:hypothetical protein